MIPSVTIEWQIIERFSCGHGWRFQSSRFSGVTGGCHVSCRTSRDGANVGFSMLPLNVHVAPVCPLARVTQTA
jgi:hypothetical protein